MELLSLKEGDRVIDLGCGDGSLTQKLADMGADVLGIDASAEMIALAKKTHPNLPFFKAIFPLANASVHSVAFIKSLL